MKALITLLVTVFLCIAVSPAEARKSRSGGKRSYSESAGKAQGTGAKSSSTRVRGHVTKSGRYVSPHARTKPDKTQRNNYGSNGNYNPHTGKTGKREPKK